MKNDKVKDELVLRKNIVYHEVVNEWNSILKSFSYLFPLLLTKKK